MKNKYGRRGGKTRVAKLVAQNRSFRSYGLSGYRAAQTIQAAVKRAIVNNNKKMLETKQSCYTNTDGLDIYHNNFINVVNSQLLQTTQGVNDPRTATTANRIGDKINLKGVSIKMMLELAEKFSDVTFRVLVVRTARGIVPDRSNLFNGLSGNKMIDTLNTEKFTVISQKYVKLKTPGPSATSTTEAVLAGSGIINYGLGQGLSRATKIVKLWIPGSKFSKNGVITYEDGSGVVKFFDYYVIVYGYSNYSTLQDIYVVGKVNDVVTQMYYTDA